MLNILLLSAVYAFNLSPLGRLVIASSSPPTGILRLPGTTAAGAVTTRMVFSMDALRLEGEEEGSGVVFS